MGHTTQLHDWLKRLQRGDETARERIIEHTVERLRKLTRRMLRSYQRVRHWSETDDVLQEMLLKLHNALAELHPESASQFYSLAGQQIRWKLIELARRYYGPLGLGFNQKPNGEAFVRNAPDLHQPDSLEEWTAFHEAVDRLPEEERKAFELFFYQGLDRATAAEVMEVSIATCGRRWLSARERLSRLLDL